jgi:tripartite-type tricarboxylate transporter receptor subunit TctC
MKVLGLTKRQETRTSPPLMGYSFSRCPTSACSHRGSDDSNASFEPELSTAIMTTRRRFLIASTAALAMPALSRRARAQAWPNRTIRAVCPFTAGSTIDILGRIITEPLSQALGQTIVLENRGGAGGSIGSAAVAKAEPDGYTLLINASAHTAAPAAYPNIAYDPAGDFAGLAMIGVVPNVLLIAERFRLSAGFKATHVPFRGGPEALTEVMTGRIDFMCVGTSSGLPFVRDGRLLALAVTTQQRSAALPDVPTTLELGFADSDYTFWNGFLAPAQTPKPIVARLHAEITKILALPVVQERLKPQGIEPMPLSPAEFDALMRREIASNLALAKAAGLKFN